MSHLSKILRNILLFFTIVGCVYVPEDPKTTGTSFFVGPGDILVINYQTNEVIALDQNGNFKRVVYSVDVATGRIVSLAWKSTSNEILIAVDGADRIMALSAYDGSERIFIATSQIALTTTGTGMAELANGEIIVAENGNTAEKLTEDGARITTGGWPKNLAFNTMRQVSATADGGFIGCSIATDQVRKFDSDGNLLATGTSAIAGTTDAYGCLEMTNGEIAIAWRGTTDSLQVYDSGLTGAHTTFDNTSTALTFADPRSVAQATNGNLLVLDYTTQVIFEVTTAGDFVRAMAGSFMKQPIHLIVIPTF